MGQVLVKSGLRANYSGAQISNTWFKDLLNTKLASVDWNINIADVQQYWNVFENLLVKIVDEIVPLAVFEGKDDTPSNVKNKINKRNGLLKSLKKNPTLDLKLKNRDLNCEIRSHFFYKKKLFVRKGILPGNSKSLWKAIKIAKNTAHTIIPNNMTLINVNVTGCNIAENFAEFFDRRLVIYRQSPKVQENETMVKRKRK